MKDIHQGDGHAGLAGAGGHDEQGLALFLGEVLADAGDGAFRIVALDDYAVYRHCFERLLRAATEDEAGEFLLLVESGHAARWVGGVIPDPSLVAVGVENDRALVIHFLKAIGVELGLLLADAGVHRGFLGFHDA